MSENTQSILTAASNYGPVLAEYGLVIILVAIAIEGIGIPAPSQSLLIAGALLSALGEFDIRLLLVSAWFAAFVGSTLGYIVGRVGGRKLLLRLPLSPTRLERMDAFCQRYGTLLVILSRFIDGPRQLTGIFVGSLQMSAITFLLATSLGAVLWVGFWGLGSLLPWSAYSHHCTGFRVYFALYLDCYRTPDSRIMHISDPKTPSPETHTRKALTRSLTRIWIFGASWRNRCPQWRLAPRILN